jgi:6-phosphogluconolactonase
MFALHRLLPCCLVLLVALGLCLTAAIGAEEAPRKLLVYVGTYTEGTKSKGIYRMELDLATGKLSEPVVAGKAVNPSFLAIHPSGKFLYAVDEIDRFGTKKGTGAVSAFALDGKTGDLALLNQEPSLGAHPCHLVTDRAGKHVLVANYTGGNATVLAIEEDGKLGKVTGHVQHEGKGVNPSRQEKPHAHSINLDSNNRFGFVADLGIDKVMIYRYEKGQLRANDPPSVKVEPGAGPRHFAFHPSGKFAYVINELDSTVTALAYDSDRGALTPIQTISTLPAGYKGRTTTAEVVVHPSGKFLYGSNRGHDSIAMFTIDTKTGKLTATGHQGKGIKTPRNFAVEPAGKFCLVANQDGDSVLVFRVDASTGKLESTDSKVEVPKPVCLRFLAWPR